MFTLGWSRIPVYLLSFTLCSCTLADSELRVGDDLVKMRKDPDSNWDVDSLRQLRDRESKSGQLEKAATAGIYMQQDFIV